MASLRSLSFEQLLRRVPYEKRYLLDCQVESDWHLAEIARKVTDWNLVLPYLIVKDSVEVEEAILGNYQTVERRRLALLQKWRENCGPNATYRNLAKSFYDAGKPHLVETVCAAVMTCDYRSKHTSQKVSISLSRAIPNATAATSSTRISSLGCKCFLLCFVTAIVVILAYNSQRGTHFVSQSPVSVSADRSRADMEGTEVGRIHYGHKTTTVHCHSILRVQELDKAVAEIGEWEPLCENLGAPVPVVKQLRSDSIPSGLKKRKCLEAYIDLGSTCWETVVLVVADHPFYNRKLAKEIAGDYGVDFFSIVQDRL